MKEPFAARLLALLWLALPLGVVPSASAQKGGMEGAPQSKGGCRSADSSFFRDEGLNVKVSSKLKFRKALFNEVIQVKVSGGVVTLSGNVSTAEQIRLAGKVAAETSGVSCVNNFLKVGPPLTPQTQPGS
ncbi:MAG: BON domain-containing protein [Betaproteobacteria bacterium]|nr:BON domain-containing protein [Betaproteobacteria bacterium]